MEFHSREMSEHKCPGSCRRSKYNCPINMQNVLWKAIHEDNYERYIYLF